MDAQLAFWPTKAHSLRRICSKICVKDSRSRRLRHQPIIHRLTENASTIWDIEKSSFCKSIYFSQMKKVLIEGELDEVFGKCKQLLDCLTIQI